VAVSPLRLRRRGLFLYISKSTPFFRGKLNAINALNLCFNDFPITMKNNTPLKLFIAEDHKLLLQGYEQLLLDIGDITLVATASNYYDIIHKLQSTPCDVLLLDLGMPMTYNNQHTRLSGLDILEFIKKSQLPILPLIISTHRDYDIIKRAITFGAKGYLFKNADLQELLAAIRVVGNGKTYFQAEVNEILKSKQEDEGRLISEGVKMSNREKEILVLMSEGLTADEIANELKLSKYTIEEYRTNLLKKFKAKNATHLVKIAFEYKFL